MLESLFSHLIPFRFLPAPERERLASACDAVSFDTGDVILLQGEVDDRQMYILTEGLVEIYDRRRDKSLGTIEPGRYFGERAALFDVPRAMDIIALEPCTCVRFQREHLLRLLAESPGFAQALGHILREKQGLFRAFDAFMAEIRHGVAEDRLRFNALVSLYEDIQPALHPHVGDRDVLDFEALTYALRRLPQGIESTFMIYLTDDLHDIFVRPVDTFKMLETHARRRAVYQMVPGKIMVLMRDGFSDLLDFLTCLCALAVEARKLRRRLSAPPLLERLIDGIHDGQSAPELLRDLGFTARERENLIRLWPVHTCQRIHELVLHHEDYNLAITKQLQTYNSRHAELWTEQIALACEELLGISPGELDRDVHIISSNTHSVHNCLSPYLHTRRTEIEAWGREHHPELFEMTWSSPTDRLYALARGYLRAHPAERDTRRRVERDYGILRLEETALTGIAVELIDTSKLDLDVIDPELFLDQEPHGRDSLIINIDYAFGQQAEEIMANLLMLFGNNLSSVNVLGKAGALCGERGDILVANSFVEQTQDLVTPTPMTHGCDLERLSQRLPDREIHEGAMLTVSGTLMQNKVLLNFYHHIWRCVGLEMEGTYYLREVMKSMHLGLIPQETTLRFLYYVSDVPLASGESLAGAMRPEEGIPPLYAITREILGSVWS